MEGERIQGRREVAANVGGKERLLSMFIGGGLIAFAMTRTRLAGRWLVLPGLLLLGRGRSGRSLLYTLFDVSTAAGGAATRRFGEAKRAERAMGERAARGARGAGATVAAAGAEFESSAESPHPRVPGGHQHAVPPTEMGAPSVQVTEKLMSEVAAGKTGSGREEEPEPER